MGVEFRCKAWTGNSPEVPSLLTGGSSETLLQLTPVRERLPWRHLRPNPPLPRRRQCLPQFNGVPHQHHQLESLQCRHRVPAPAFPKAVGTVQCQFLSQEGGYAAGAYNMMVKLSKDQLDKGVICSFTENHAQGVALAAKKLGRDAVIAMSVTTPEIKWKSVERLGATIVLVGDSYDEAQSYAKQRSEEEGRTFMPPFNHPDVVMGQGTIVMEIICQLKGKMHAVFVPVGGGGLIAGIAAYVKQVRP